MTDSAAWGDMRTRTQLPRKPLAATAVQNGKREICAWDLSPRFGVLLYCAALRIYPNTGLEAGDHTPLLPQPFQRLPSSAARRLEALIKLSQLFSDLRMR